MDKRAEREVGNILAIINEKELYYKTGLRESPLFFPAKILWVKKNKPWILDKAKWILQLKDYIFYKPQASHIHCVFNVIMVIIL